jgi:two-component system phosphate regulon sensor histidine kinase PhoR
VDSGKGISEEELSRIGQKFYRIENYISEEEGRPDLVRPGGTGLGLYVTFGLVDKMGGKMDVKSEIGKGTKFTFMLPRYKKQDEGVTKVVSKDMFQRLGLKK